MSKLIDMSDLELMRAVKSEASLSAAAKHLHVSRSAISKRLQKIESIIGKPILCPTDGNNLTKSGKFFSEFAMHTLKKYEEFLTQIGNIKNGTELIRIMGNPSVMAFDLPSAITQLANIYPGIEFDISDGNFDDIIKSIISGDIEVGIVPDNPQIAGLIFYRYRHENLCVLANKYHPIAGLKSVNIEELSAHRLIGTSRNGVIANAVKAAAMKANLKLSYAAHIKDYDLHASMIAESKDGAGVTFLRIAEKWVKNGNVVKIDIAEKWADRNFFIVTQKYDTMPNQIHELIRLMLKN